MQMHNPPHPGEFIRDVYLTPHDISIRKLALSLGVAPSTVARLIKGLNAVSPEMALRLSVVLGRSPESWLKLQQNYDLWVARQHLDLSEIHPLRMRT